MNNRLKNSQLSNFKTYNSYLLEMLTLAESVFIFENLPKMIDLSYMNSKLFRNGSVAFFKDEVLDEVLALPYRNFGKKDLYGRPIKIEVFGENGYSRILNRDEYVIMYDNTTHYPMYLNVLQHAERMALIKRTMDINIQQQRTPRFWLTPTEKKRTVEDLLNRIDGNVNTILAYDDLDLDEVTCVLEPAPYVADKLNESKENEWSEFLTLIGISNVSFMKRERNISDEIGAMMGGTIANRYSRFEPRKSAIDKINEKWGLNIELKYYDSIPNSEEEFIKEGDDYDELLDVSINDSKI